MIWFALVVLVFALCAAIPVTVDKLPSVLLGVYWMFSWIGQLFALPLLLIVAVAAGFAQGAAMLVLIAGAVLFGIAHWRNRRAGRVLLGAVGLDELRIPLLAGLFPPATGASRARRIKDIAYGEAGSRNQLDLILPKLAPPTPMPILVHVHGGAWISGAKNQQSKPLLHHLAAQGWLCVDLNYRLGPKHHCPEMIVDVLRAVAWVRAHAAEHGGDPARIAITGGSAGGHLAALAALTHDDPAFKPGFESADCSVAAAVPLYGRYDFLDRRMRLKGNHVAVVEGFMAKSVMPGLPATCMDLWHAVSPIDRVRADAPPMLVVHGTGDTMLPFGDAQDFAAGLKAVSTAPVTYVELPGIQHAWDMLNSALTWAHVRAVSAFLKPLAERSASSRPAP